MDYKDGIKNPQKFWEETSLEEMKAVMEKQRAEVPKHRTTYTVCEIRGGVCPVYKVGDKLVIDSDIVETVNMELSDAVCFSLLDNLHYRTMWDRMPRVMYDHLTITNGESRTICAHPGPPYTPCGGVIVNVTREEF